MTIRICAFGFIAPVIHHLRPLITYSSPSRSIRVAMLVASDEATSGSVIANPERILPFSRGSSHRCFCSGEPNIASSSMFPVSGGAQFRAAGAMCIEWPVISANGAYCRFVSPAPFSPGRNRFHRPRRRASARSSARMGTESQAHRSSSAASCCANTGSAGWTWESMNSRSDSCSSSVWLSRAKSIS